MSSNNNNRPKRSAENSSLVHTVASGPVLADIYRGVTADGHVYLYYVLSRAWRPQTGLRENYSNRFYERNEIQIVEISHRASEWIRNNPRAADQQCERKVKMLPLTVDPQVAPQMSSVEPPSGNGREKPSDAM